MVNYACGSLAGIAPMKEITRLRELEADCRQRAQSEPERKWYWLAQAAKYQIQANLEVAENATEPNAPEVRLASWPIGGDERRLH
jgi:hypothetical protein